MGRRSMMTVLARTTILKLPLAVAAAVLALMPLEARAQAVSTSFQELQSRVKRGDTIEITQVNGKKNKGRVGELTPGSLELLVRKTGRDGLDTYEPGLRVSEQEVRQIRL